MDLVVCDRPNDNHMGTLFLPSLSCHLLTSVHTFIPLNPSIFYLSVSLPLLPAPPVFYSGSDLQPHQWKKSERLSPKCAAPRDFLLFPDLSGMLAVITSDRMQASADGSAKAERPLDGISHLQRSGRQREGSVFSCSPDKRRASTHCFLM